MILSYTESKLSFSGILICIFNDTQYCRKLILFFYQNGWTGRARVVAICACLPRALSALPRRVWRAHPTTTDTSDYNQLSPLSTWSPEILYHSHTHDQTVAPIPIEKLLDNWDEKSADRENLRNLSNYSF